MSRAAAMHPMDEAAREGRFALQACAACGAGQYPPREVCRLCLSDDLAWHSAESVPGELLAITRVCHSFEPSHAGQQAVGLVRIGPGMTAVCFFGDARPGPVVVRASQDRMGRAVLTAC